MIGIKNGPNSYIVPGEKIKLRWKSKEKNFLKAHFDLDIFLYEFF